MKWFAAFCTLALSLSALASTEPLRPEAAFQVGLSRIDAKTLSADFHIVPGHYLYRERFTFIASRPLAADYPAGIIKEEPDLGRAEIYPQDISIRLNSPEPIDDNLVVELRYQGCAEGKLCYPQQTISLRPGEHSSQHNLPVWQMQEQAPLAAKAMSFSPPSPETRAPESTTDTAYFGNGFWATLGIFLLAGLGLSFTACMYPLIPIVSGIVLGQHCQSRAHALGLTFTYIQGLAICYALIGIAAAATGTFLTVALQQPLVIGGFAFFFVLMALASFGAFNMHLPTSWLSRLNAWASRLPGGHIGPVFVMGMISALIVGPCNLPPLAAALAYLGRTGDITLGGAALYAMALGAGLPLLAIAGFGHLILPKLSGYTMQIIRAVFGILLLGVAVWVTQPLWPQAGKAKPEPHAFQTIRTGAELDAALLANQDKPVLLDFYADWCVSCKEMDEKTLKDPVIEHALARWTLLRIDITANTEADRQLLTRFGLFAPPALILFQNGGSKNIVGFQTPEALLPELGAAEHPRPDFPSKRRGEHRGPPPDFRDDGRGPPDGIPPPEPPAQ